MPLIAVQQLFQKQYSLARANQLTGNKTYLDLSISGFKRVWDGSYDPEKGGMFLDFNRSGKNACINFPTVIAAMTLYKITGEAAYVPRQINDTTSFS